MAGLSYDALFGRISHHKHVPPRGGIEEIFVICKYVSEKLVSAINFVRPSGLVVPSIASQAALLYLRPLIILLGTTHTSPAFLTPSPISPAQTAQHVD